MKQVIIYSRRGCHLCESARAELESIRSEIQFNLEEALIDGDSKLEEEYGLMVPVILSDLVEFCDQNQMVAALASIP